MAGPEWWHRRVKPRYKDLLAALRPSAILDDLLTEGVISLEDYNVCHTEKTESDRSRRLLTQILPYGGEGRLDTFCEVLARSEQQNHLVELIGKRTSVHVQPYVQPVRESMQQHGAGIPQTYPSANGQPVQQPLSMQSQLESRQPPTTTTVAFQASHQSSGLASYRASAASGFGMYAQTAPSTTEHTIQYMRSAAATEPELARSSGTRQHQSVAPTVVLPRSTPPSAKGDEYKSLCRAVLRHGSSRWMAIGRQLGYSTNQILDITGHVVNQSDKLKAVLDNTVDAHGYELAICEIQRACRDISSPIYGAVREEVERH